jgi:hypothetical protein
VQCDIRILSPGTRRVVWATKIDAVLGTNVQSPSRITALSSQSFHPRLPTQAICEASA